MKPITRLRNQIREIAPWDVTRASLWRERVPTRAKATEGHGAIASAYRESQFPALLTMIVPDVTEIVGDQIDVQRLRPERMSARLFLDDAARVGKGVYDPQDSLFNPDSQGSLFDIRPEDRALVEVLRLLAIAADASSRDREFFHYRWGEVDPRANLGLVLTPIARRARANEPDFESTDVLLFALARALRATPDELSSWTAGFVREGAQRMRELLFPRPATR